jgi:hypothetical protein
MTNAARSRVFAARYGDQADSKMNEWNEQMNKTISLGAVCMAWGCRCVFYGKDCAGAGVYVVAIIKCYTSRGAVSRQGHVHVSCCLHGIITTAGRGRARGRVEK